MMLKRYIRPFGTLLTLVLVAVMLVGCTSKATAPQHSHQIHVVASLDFYGETAKAVLGKKGTVTSIIDKPSMEPHEFEPTTKTAKQVSKADVIIYNGLGYDTWMNRLSADNTGTTKVNVAQGIMNKHDGDNEHIWYDMKTMPKLANELANQFAKRQPQNKAYFKRNAQRYIRSLKPLDQKVAQLRQNSHQARVNVSEPVFDYSLTEMGYRQNNNHYAQAVQNDTDPSPKDIRQMQADIRHHKIAFFVVNTQEISKMTTNLLALAKNSGVPIVRVTESQPSNTTYKTWMMQQFNDVQRAQEATR
ncbi:metal ABC transporter substrate-binding protein [Secundilactobacillus silagincola]|uniref:Metal ABC transporter substrate-binding protein n=1 Tax=Secundilactobacillus silagincola TaxID=1714681 RepID=A0A1Z5IZT5_9LACO|nr:metal ABC transporter solute-binding protein [Secundilactobacillus silagincola]GAX07314.1 metal ABC transporter substrate-binding protein [Secundilactobacillus silagincola]